MPSAAALLGAIMYSMLLNSALFARLSVAGNSGTSYIFQGCKYLYMPSRFVLYTMA